MNRASLPGLSALAAVGVLLSACGDDDATSDEPAVDMGVPRDAGREGEDAAVADGGDTSDAGAADSGAMDAGAPDGGPCVLGASTSGQATTYTAGAVTNCGVGDAWTPLRVALAPGAYAAGAACGECLLVTGSGGSHVVLVDDQCPGCAADQIDLEIGAWNAVTGDAAPGIEAVSWQPVPCMPPGNAFWDLQGSNPWYLKIRVSQHVTPLASLAVEVGGTYSEAARQPDGFFTFSPGVELTPPIAVRATDTFGSTIDFAITDLTNDTMHDTGTQFPVMCAP